MRFRGGQSSSPPLCHPYPRASNTQRKQFFGELAGRPFVIVGTGFERAPADHPLKRRLALSELQVNDRRLTPEPCPISLGKLVWHVAEPIQSRNCFGVVGTSLCPVTLRTDKCVSSRERSIRFQGNRRTMGDQRVPGSGRFFRRG